MSENKTNSNPLWRELQKFNSIAYWWNMRRKKLDFSGTVADLLKSKDIKVKKVKDKQNPELDCYVFTTCHRVTYKHFGNVLDGAYTALKLWYATMGDKATVTVASRIFTINH